MNTPLQTAAQQAILNFENMAESNWRNWQELASAEEFEKWVKRRASHMVANLSKALADEQAQAANSRAESLYEELRKAIDGGSESMTHDDALKQIAYWQDKEQAQAVEPHGWMIDGMSEVMSRGHAQAVQAEHQAMGGTAVAYPVYLHPAPPPAGERRTMIAVLRGFGIKILGKAADMLEADAAAYEQGRYDELQAQGPSQAEWAAMEAQQVAVPDGMALVPTEALLNIKNRVNTLATLSLKAERYSVGRAIKQDVADMLAATQGAKP